jgi:transitional endoplasmic reticulum ATPase
MFKDSLELCNSVKKIKNTKLVSRSKVDNESNTVPASGKLIGFNAIAGMGKLKYLLQRDVIDVLKEPKLYESYGLNIPNGMLLYGPPGCGKTFFAEKLAEEVGFKFYQLKPSDIQSQWVNESQQNVKAIFEDAVNNAPSILFVDELDAVVPKRDGNNVSHMNTSVVNEFLAQMNNLGEQGVFVIGATNHPEGIDSAVLRSGRLDKKILIPPPDNKSRMAMLKLILSSRPVSSDLDYQSLADVTEGYVASDIKLICDDASRIALAQREVISMEMLLHSIKENPSSLDN